MFSKVLFRTLASFSTLDLLQILQQSLSLVSSSKGTIENILDNDPRDLIGDFSKVMVSRCKPLAMGCRVDGAYLEPLPCPPPPAPQPFSFSREIPAEETVGNFLRRGNKFMIGCVLVSVRL